MNYGYTAFFAAGVCAVIVGGSDNRMEFSANGSAIVPAVDSRHIPERLPAGPDDSSAPGLVAPSRYADVETESFYFVSPGGNYECAIRITSPGLAGCHGPFPPDAPAVRSAVQEELVRPNLDLS
jgi:hypothetical protein